MSIINNITYEIREDNSVELSGYISVCERDSKRLMDKVGYFVEQIMPNAFRRSLESNPNIPILFNHKWDRELGRNGVNECEIYEDNIGLRYKIRTNDAEVVELARAGKLSGTSFGFQSIKESATNIASGLRRRFIHELRLLECSILSVEPAYVATSVEVRAKDGEEIEIRSNTVNDELTKIREAIDDLQEKEKELMAQLEDIEVEEAEISKEEITTEENLEDKNEVDTVNEVEPTEEEKVTSEDVDAEVLDEEIKEVVEELNNDEFKGKLKLFIDIHKAKM